MPHLVSLDWFLDSMESGKIMPAEKYLLKF
jgi:hypothetical protein